MADSSWLMRMTGMPVHIATTSAMFSSVTRGFSTGWAGSAAASAGGAPSAAGSVAWPDSSFSIFSRSLTSRSRSSAASSYCWAVIAASFSFCTASRPAQRLLERGRGGRLLQPDAARGLVDQVDRLVGQEAVGDVARAELGRGLDRLVGDLELVVRLVAVLDAAQDLDRLLDRGLLDLDRLEAALERGVLLDVLAVLVERGRADRLQLAAGERRLEDVGRVDRALGRAGADQRVQLVDEEHAVAGGLDLLDDLLEPLLELAAVLGAGDERADVERQQPLAHQRLRHVAGDDALGQALDDRGLADARLADQGRVVLGPPREDLDDPLDLARAADAGVELAGARGGRQVDAHLVDRRRPGRLPRLVLGVARGLREDVDDLGAHPVERDAEALEHAGGDALALADEAEQQVLGPDVLVVEAPRLVDRQLDHLLGPRGQADLAHDHAVAAADDELDRRAHLVELDAQVRQDLGGDALALADQPEQQVLGADVVVVEALGLFLREGQDLPRPLGELVETIRHWRPPGLTRCTSSNYTGPIFGRTT